VRRLRDGIRGRLLAVYSRLHAWAEAGWSGTAVGTWGALQGSVVPGPSDALLVPLGLADPRRALYFAGCATVGATIGGLVAYVIGAELFDTVGRPLAGYFGIGAARIESSRALFDRRAWLVIAVSALTPIPTKITCIFAGAFGVPLGEFTLALVGGRALRFSVEGAVIMVAGERLRAVIERRMHRDPARPRAS
jgi:membrane protein YqaA with SNARE-associated domain